MKQSYPTALNARKIFIDEVKDQLRLQILCVDDDPRARGRIWKRLKASGIECDVTATVTGRSAFSLLAEREFDLCIMEYALPDMTGAQLCGLLRQIGCTIPVVFLTAMDRPVDRQNARNAGADEYLGKPKDLDRLGSSIRTQIARRRARLAEGVLNSVWPTAAKVGE